jgi:hypothetical protein
MPSEHCQPSKDGDAESLPFGPHAVALVDFLGQSAGLAEWDFSPVTDDQREGWLAAVRTTMGRVMELRERFSRACNDFLNALQTYAGSHPATAPAEVVAEFNRFRATKILFAHFSDTIIVYTPLLNEHDYWQVSNIGGLLISCGTLFLQALATGTVLRGAIEVGMLGQFPTGDPYGPVLASAHRLESRIADYPRIVVGPDVCRYLTWLENLPGGQPATSANRALADMCRTMLTEDDDGCTIVDYLAGPFLGEGTDAEKLREERSLAYRFASRELERFQKARDTHLAARYERLLAYLRSHGGS